MPKYTDRAIRRWRAATLLAVGAVIGIVMVATPAGAHFGTVTHLWNQHIKPKADARYSRVLIMQPPLMVLTSTTDTPIASGTYRAAGRCALVMDGTLDWDDNSGANILFMQWYVDGAPVGGDFAYQGGGTGNNLAASATAGAVISRGSHTVELRARVTSGSADLEDIGAYAFCGYRTGTGAAVTPRPATSSKTLSRGDTTQ